MSDVVIVDTSVFLNVLDVPAFNQNRDAILDQFERLLGAGNSLLLPMAAVFETGDHITDLSDGRLRRRYAERFRTQVRKALNGEAPWTLIPLPDSERLSGWLEGFPDHAMRGVGLSDLSIIKAWEAACARHQTRRVRIWSLDQHLQGYDRGIHIRIPFPR